MEDKLEWVWNWISVAQSKKFPDKYVLVRIPIKNDDGSIWSDYWIAKYIGDGWWKERNGRLLQSVTHWTPIPKYMGAEEDEK